jgi:hypothetical protein
MAEFLLGGCQTVDSRNVVSGGRRLKPLVESRRMNSVQPQRLTHPTRDWDTRTGVAQVIHMPQKAIGAIRRLRCGNGVRGDIDIGTITSARNKQRPVMQEGEGREPGTVLIWIGIFIATVSSALLIYWIMTCCPCRDDSTEDEVCSCACGYGIPILLIIVGIAIVIIGYLIRYLNRREVACEKRP